MMYDMLLYDGGLQPTKGQTRVKYKAANIRTNSMANWVQRAERFLSAR